MPKQNKKGNWSEKRSILLRELQEAAAAHTGLSTSKAITDTPTAYIDDSIDPDNLKYGYITEIYIQLNWANAVDLNYIRFYSGAKAGNYELASLLLFDTAVQEAGGLTDDQPYRFEFNPPRRFTLEEVGKIYYGPNWSAACGNIQGFIVIKGDTYI